MCCIKSSDNLNETIIVFFPRSGQCGATLQIDAKKQRNFENKELEHP